jgi:hypothetical protein
VRTTTGDLGAEAEVVLAHALESLGLQLVPPDEGGDLAVDVGSDRVVTIKVKTLSLANPSRVRSLLARNREVERRDRVDVLVADTLTAAAKKLLADSRWGWLDRRGHVFLRRPGLHVDAIVPATPRRPTESGEALVGKAGVATALALLMHPHNPPGVRATAFEAGLNPSSVSRALRRLRDHLLVEPDGRPAVPELFWVLADAWPRSALALKRRPRPEDAEPLGVVADDLERPGWALTGARAALAWGAPVMTARSPLLELVVPSDAVARRARQRLGDAATPRSAAATLRVAPVPMAVRHRQRATGERVPLAHPVVVALDLAGDLSRGTEILDKWTPPPPFVRVW